MINNNLRKVLGNPSNRDFLGIFRGLESGIRSDLVHIDDLSAIRSKLNE